MLNPMSVDLLSSLLSRISLRGHVYSRPVGCGEWQVNPSGAAQASYHLLAGGECWLHLRDQVEPTRLRQGDLVFFPRDSWHVLSADRTLSDDLTRLPPVDGGVQTRLICGMYRSDDQELERLLRGLPDFVVIRAGEADTRISQVIGLLTSEEDPDAPGSALLLDSLSDVLLALIFRYCLQHGLISHGLLSALSDPRLAAVLAAIHAEPGADWDMEALAARAALSRSTFAERFRQTTGVSPGQYLAELRMQEASVLLRNERLSVAQIAERMGYATEAAFRRAFRRTVGRTPGEVRRGVAVGGTFESR